MHRSSCSDKYILYILCLLMLSYAQYSGSHRAWSRSDANSDHQMTHRRRCSLPRHQVDLERGQYAADGRRLLSHVRDFRHPRIIIQHGCSDAPRHCHPVASRPRATAPFMSWGGGPPTSLEDIPAPTHRPATVDTFTSSKGAVPANDGVSFHAPVTTPSRAVVVF